MRTPATAYIQVVWGLELLIFYLAFGPRMLNKSARSLNWNDIIPFVCSPVVGAVKVNDTRAHEPEPVSRTLWHRGRCYASTPGPVDCQPGRWQFVNIWTSHCKRFIILGNLWPPGREWWYWFHKKSRENKLLLFYCQTVKKGSARQHGILLFFQFVFGHIIILLVALLKSRWKIHFH